MEYLVTGATGFVGNNIVRRLLASGHSVRTYTRSTSDKRPLQSLNVDRYSGDITDFESVRKAVSGANVVFHCAANLHIGWKDLDRIRKINVEGTRNVVEAAIAFDAKLIHVSTVDALADAAAPGQHVSESSQIKAKVPCTYVVTKQEAEQIVLDRVSKDLNAVVANPGFMLGPWDWKPSSGRMLLAIANGFVPLAPSGGMSICDVRDVVEVLIRMADADTKCTRYILAGHNIKYHHAWNRFARITGSRAPIGPMGPLVRMGAGWIGDLRASLTGKESDINSAMIRMSSLLHYYDSSRAKLELGYQIRPVDEIIRGAWKWFQENGYAKKANSGPS